MYNMVDLIINPNPRIDQKLLFESVKSYNEKTSKPINMRILNSTITTNPNDEDEDILELFLEIRNGIFKCKAYGMEDGILNKNKIQLVKASFETVQINYTLNKEKCDKYRVECNDPLFLLLNYGLQERNRIMPGNNQGFKDLKHNEITNTLNHLNFGVVIREWYGQNVLMAVDMDKWEEINIREIN